MFIVVESGSTKADWMVIEDAQETVHSTKGFNPLYHSEQDILTELRNHRTLESIRLQVKDLYFYGAGCATPERNKIVYEGLKSFFVNAEIHVDSDLNASAFACYNNRPEIACILGTGSNSCLYDGKQVTQKMPSLGYILGDEASGSYFGKRLLADFLYGKLPEPMHRELEQQGLSKTNIIDRVYRQPNANVFIASLMPVLVRNKNLPYAQQLIRNGFQEFIDLHVKCYPNYSRYEVNFVGSLADLLQEELRDVCAQNAIEIGGVIRRPLEQLVRYHRELRGENA